MSFILVGRNIDEIHGDHLRGRKKRKLIFGKILFRRKSSSKILNANSDVAAIKNMRVIEISGSPFYEFEIINKDKKTQIRCCRRARTVKYVRRFPKMKCEKYR